MPEQCEKHSEKKKLIFIVLGFLCVREAETETEAEREKLNGNVPVNFRISK